MTGLTHVFAELRQGTKYESNSARRAVSAKSSLREQLGDSCLYSLEQPPGGEDNKPLVI